MKPFTCVLLAVLIGPSPALAAVEQCRFIQSNPDREACYDRQAKQLAAKRTPDVDEAKPKSVDELTTEDDKLSKSLRSICRGC
jgi:hypothetical protein